MIKKSLTNWQGTCVSYTKKIMLCVAVGLQDT